jgi:LysM repeat protein
MRKHLMTAAMLVSLTPFAARAQSDEGDAPEAPEGSAEVAQPPPSDGQPAAAPRRDANTQHTVEKGDTLWDLSQRYLGSPWYWPKVWSYNPDIANPHWIYPGNQVRFHGGGEDVPTQVEAGPQVGDVDEGSMVNDDDKVVVTGQIGFKPRATQTLALPGFVTPAEVDGAGAIIGAFSETAMLSFPDLVYVRFDKQRAKVGETYVVFRRGAELFHPTSGDSVGFYTKILGEVRVNRVEKNGTAVVQITRQFDVIQRDDLIGPAGESLLRKVAARPADRDVKDGVIVASTTSFHAMMGEHETIVIDRGSDHGVKTGNVFHATRQHDGLPQDVMLNPTRVEEAYPQEDVGQCVAVEVKSKATVCLVSRSLRELVRGDRVEIRAGTSGVRASR